jgi:hypothetical protein
MGISAENVHTMRSYRRESGSSKPEPVRGFAAREANILPGVRMVGTVF